MTKAKLSGADVAQHNSRESCWVIVHGKAYDVTDFLPGWCPFDL
jgi:L-lactate dehydrogenase (cytochrome)